MKLSSKQPGVMFTYCNRTTFDFFLHVNLINNTINSVGEQTYGVATKNYFGYLAIEKAVQQRNEETLQIIQTQQLKVVAETRPAS